MSIQTHLSMLIDLATIDDDFDEKEKYMVYMIGKANGLSKGDVDDLIENPHPLENIGSLSFDQKFEYLFNIIQLMKIDHEVFITEIHYCEDMAERLGFDRGVIGTLSKHIYADPSITGDRESLKKSAQKYLK
ncbi:MAG: TerB family tellurite resistance protein [Bacteroidetes bacterium]|nr:TerB family tellurite resistance protein [Bacteroidota bacterium]MDA1119064.1 TerB family tellurite resistance protein [Bacteroidota bacterium]